MSNAMKGTLDFGDLKSSKESPAITESKKVSSPRSPVGRTDKRTKKVSPLKEKKQEIKKPEVKQKEVVP